MNNRYLVGAMLICVALVASLAFTLRATPAPTAIHTTPAVANAGQQAEVATLTNALAKVDEFYSRAWDKLTINVTLAVAFAGILFPIMLQLAQRESLKRDESRL